MESRILSVADVVDAMTTHRPYRPALGLGVAIDEIESIIYDHEVVEASLLWNQWPELPRIFLYQYTHSFR